MSSGRIRLLYTRLRKEEKLLVEAGGRKNLPCVAENIRDRVFPAVSDRSDVFLCRCIGHHQNLAAARLLEGRGNRIVNASRVIELCGDKVATSSLLEKAGIPQPRFRVAFSREGAIEAAEELGYPVVFKPAVGSWGRLLAKVPDRETAESITEHKEHLGPHHQVFYLQEWIEKPGFDIRAFIVGGVPLCAIRRHSAHWITNTARGGAAENHPVDTELESLLLKIQEAVQGDFLAVDCFLTKDGYLVNEINDGAEFRNSIEPTKTDIAGAVMDLCKELLKGKTSAGIRKPEKKDFALQGPEVPCLP